MRRFYYLALLIIIVIVIAVIVIFKLYRPQADNLHDIFGFVTHIRELPQLQFDHRLREYSDWDGFRTYNPSIFTLNGSNLGDGRSIYYVYRVCNFALCPGTRNRWNSRYRERTLSQTVIETPRGDLYLVKHPRLEKLFPNEEEMRFDHQMGKSTRRNCEQGGEDARPFVIGNKLYLISNATTGYHCRRQMILMQFDLKHLEKNQDQSDGMDENLTEISPKKIWQLHYDEGASRDQKNWMPFSVNKSNQSNRTSNSSELHFVYSVNPHVILKFENDGYCRKVASTWHPDLSEELRGGSQIIRVVKWNLRSRRHLDGQPRYFAEDLYLGVLHKRDSTFEYTTYLYAFETKHPYRVKYITDGFVFGEHGCHSRKIQFAAGLARIIKPDGAYLYITYGENDCTAKLCILKEEDVLRSLRRL